MLPGARFFLFGGTFTNVRHRLAIAALFVYALALFQPFAPFIEYAVNKDFIASTLCINRDVVDSNCQGKCYLAAQLQGDYDSHNGDEFFAPGPIQPHVGVEESPLTYEEPMLVSSILPTLPVTQFIEELLDPPPQA